MSKFIKNNGRSFSKRGNNRSVNGGNSNGPKYTKNTSQKTFSDDNYSPEDLIDGSGEVKFFNQSKGFGFVSINGQDKDAFIHITVLEKNNLNDLNEGDKLKFKMINTEKNLKIVELIED